MIKKMNLLTPMNLVLVLLILVIKTAIVTSKDRTQGERAARASFVQKLINKNKHLEGRVRLVGSDNEFEGNVYVYHAGRWGAICDDSWDNAAAQVICRYFNKTAAVATHGGQFGEARRNYWMDDVVCEGDESSISSCIFSGWGSTDCDITEAAGVICRDKPYNTTPENLSEKLLKKTKTLKDILDAERDSLRIIGGRNRLEGRIEIYHNGVWGSICPDGWTLYEAASVCRHLALGFAEQALQTNAFGYSKIVLSGVHCEGNETNLFSCHHQEIGDVVCPGKTVREFGIPSPGNKGYLPNLNLYGILVAFVPRAKIIRASGPKQVSLNYKGHVAAVICTTKLADLALDINAIEQSAHLQDVPLYQLQCAMEENCLSKSAYQIQKTNPEWQFETRRLLRFTASSLNIGNEEFRPYLPKHLWQWHLCHMHYHSMEVFATFDVLDYSGNRVAEGHKASFCLEDNTCLPGVDKKYSCKNYGDQGISVNCSDVYQYSVDCQWVDVTDISLGDYTFKVTVNPHARIAEQQYHNNAARCKLRLTDTYVAVYSCTLERP